MGTVLAVWELAGEEMTGQMIQIQIMTSLLKSIIT